MKHLFYLALTLVFSSLLWAEDPQGPSVYVELNSGTKQKAQYLGTVKDTVILGGYIQNTYTKIKLPKSAFKNIQDSAGNILLSSEESGLLIAEKTKNTPSSSATEDSTESSASVCLKGKTILIPLQHRGIDSLLSIRLLDLTEVVLREQDLETEVYQRTFFSECKDTDCIRSTSNELGAIALWSGEIIPAKTQESLILKLEHSTFPQKKPKEINVTLSAKTPIQDLLKNEKWLLFLKNKQVKEKTKKGANYVYVETTPEGASISKRGKSAICKTPCGFSTLDTGKIVLDAYWHINDHLWGNSETIQIIPEDTTKVSLKLKRIDPEIEMVTTPLGASIFLGRDPISIKKRPLGTTPKRLKTIEPGLAEMRFWKEGYRDTVVEFYINVTEKTILSIDLEPLVDLKAIEEQQKWITTKKKYFWGLTITGSALAPFVTGAIFTYLSKKDYEEARKIKKILSQPSIADGENHQKLVDKNKNLVKKGDSKLYIGSALFATSALMLGIGLTLLF